MNQYIYFLLERVFGVIPNENPVNYLKDQCKISKTVDTRLETTPYNEWIMGIYEDINGISYAKS